MKERTLVGALFLAVALQLVYGLRTDGLTDDEAVYIGAGYRHLHGDFTINGEQPPVAKLLAALPLLALGVAPTEHRATDDQDGWAYRFIHETNRALPVLPLARVPAVLLALGIAVLVWMWARSTGGPRAGLLALALVAFQPTLLAHGHLATTDLPSGAFMLGASWLFWRHLDAPSLPRATLVVVAATLAALSRLTALGLLPSFVLLAAIDLFRTRDRARVGRAVGFLFAAGLVVAPLVAWTAYGFRAPHALLEAVRFQVEHNARGHQAYLLGEPSREGWPYYYLIAFLVKNTPGFLGLFAVAFRQSHRNPVGPRWHWLVPAIVLFVGASVGRIHIGERYILGLYPYLALWIAVTCAPMLDSRRGRGIVAVLLAMHVIPVLRVAPRGYLTYFNAIAGGPEGGHRWLADSNLDWGQDLPRLAAWMRAHQVPRVQLAYFGSDDPDRYGIAHTDLASWHSHHPRHTGSAPSAPVVLSPNLLLGYLVWPAPNPYEAYRERRPDARAGIFFIYLPEGSPREGPR